MDRLKCFETKMIGICLPITRAGKPNQRLKMAPAEIRFANVFRQEVMELGTPSITNDGKPIETRKLVAADPRGDQLNFVRCGPSRPEPAKTSLRSHRQIMPLTSPSCSSTATQTKADVKFAS